MRTEADARIVIDRLLRQAGWDIENKSVVSTEKPAADGRADYLLKNQRTLPLAVVARTRRGGEWKMKAAKPETKR